MNETQLNTAKWHARKAIALLDKVNAIFEKLNSDIQEENKKKAA